MDEISPLQRMVASGADDNARDLELELAWFAAVLDARLRLYFQPAAASDPAALTEISATVIRPMLSSCASTN
jgi:hypothetical protein